MDESAQEHNCIALLEGIFREGKVHFLIGDNSGMLAWQTMEDGTEIIAIHSLPESWGTCLGSAMLTVALNQIGNQHVFLWAFKENTRARRFYEKHGIHRDGSERQSEFDGALEVRYVKRIAKYKVITLCGSTRFEDAFLEARKKLTLEGNIVISVGLFGHSGDSEVWTKILRHHADAGGKN